LIYPFGLPGHLRVYLAASGERSMNRVTTFDREEWTPTVVQPRS